MKTFNKLPRSRAKLDWIKNYLIYIILFAAAVLRLFKITERDFWYDESFTGIVIKESFSKMMNIIIQDVHPPLYYICVKSFASFFGYGLFGIRLFSAILGVLAVWVVYLLAKELFNKKAALWASLLTAISPFAIQYSQEARMYAMFGLLILAATLFFIKGLKNNKTMDYIFWGIFLGLACLTHYMGIIFLPCYFIAFIYWKLTEGGKSKLKTLTHLKQILLGYGVTALIFLPWIKTFYYHLTRSKGGLTWITPATPSDFFTTIRIFIFGTPLGEMAGGLTGMPIPNSLRYIPDFFVFLLVAILVTSVIIYLLIKEEKRKVVFLLLFSFGVMFLLYFLSLLKMHYFVSRYLLPSAYSIFILLGLWLSRIKIYSSLLILVLYIALLSLIIPVQYSTGWNKLKENSNKYEGNTFYVLNSFDYVIAKYYFGTNNLILYNLDWPQFNPYDWAAMGSGLKRTESFNEVRYDNKGVIISNTILYDQIKKIKDANDKRYFDFTDLRAIDGYDNVEIYKFEN